MHNKVVYHAMKALSACGLPVLRFNFRGTGLSEGEHDGGLGEQDDVRAALNWLEQNFQRPILFAELTRTVAPSARAAAESEDQAPEGKA